MLVQNNDILDARGAQFDLDVIENAYSLPYHVNFAFKFCVVGLPNFEEFVWMVPYLFLDETGSFQIYSETEINVT